MSNNVLVTRTTSPYSIVKTRQGDDGNSKVVVHEVTNPQACFLAITKMLVNNGTNVT